MTAQQSVPLPPLAAPAGSAFHSRKRCRPSLPPTLAPQAAADFFGVRIGIISSFADDYLIEVEPRERKSSRGERRTDCVPVC